MTTPSTPADWYPDPEDPHGLRYWDGTSWTEHRAPAVTPAEPAAGVPATAVAPATTARPSPYESPTAATGYTTSAPAYPPNEQSSSGPNKKLLGILGGVAALVLVVAVVLVYFFVIKKDDTATNAAASPSASTSASSSKASSSKTTDTKTTEATTEPEKPTFVPSSAEPVVSGNLSFSIADIQPAARVTSKLSDQVGKSAEGTYAIVSLQVKNVGTESTTFLSSLQRMNASGQLLTPDPEATAYLDSIFADLEPGQQVTIPVVFDVPDDAKPDSLTLVENPVTPAAEIPIEFE